MGIKKLIMHTAAIPLGYYYASRSAPEDWFSIQSKQITRLVLHAKENSPYFSKLYKDVNLANFEDLPVVERDDWRRSLREIVTNVSPEWLLWYRSTSGSTGTPALVPTMWLDEIKLRAVSHAFYLTYGRTPFTRVLTLRTSDDQPQTKKSPTGRIHFKFGSPSDHIAALLHDKSPILYGTAHTFLRVALLCEQERIKLPLRRSVIVGGETLTPAVKRTVENIFGCKVYPIYAASDYGLLAAACRKGSLHILPRSTRIEIDSPEHSKPGEVIVTNVLSHTAPIIRLRTKDWAQWNTPPCSCGNPLPSLTVLGRRDARVIRPDGKEIWWPEVYKALQPAGDGIRAFQVEQTNEESVIVRLVEAAPLPRKCHANLTALFSDMELSVQSVQTIDAEKNGKTRIIKRFSSAG